MRKTLLFHLLGSLLLADCQIYFNLDNEGIKQKISKFEQNNLTEIINGKEIQYNPKFTELENCLNLKKLSKMTDPKSLKRFKMLYSIRDYPFSLKDKEMYEKELHKNLDFYKDVSNFSVFDNFPIETPPVLESIRLGVLTLPSVGLYMIAPFPPLNFIYGLKLSWVNCMYLGES